MKNLLSKHGISWFYLLHYIHYWLIIVSHLSFWYHVKWICESVMFVMIAPLKYIYQIIISCCILCQLFKPPKNISVLQAITICLLHTFFFHNSNIKNWWLQLVVEWWVFSLLPVIVKLTIVWIHKYCKYAKQRKKKNSITFVMFWLLLEMYLRLNMLWVYFCPGQYNILMKIEG